MRSRARVIMSGIATAVWVAVMQAAALAQGYPGGDDTPQPTVGGTKFFPGDDELGRTGFDLLALIVIALAILAVGFALYRLSRSATTSDT